MDRIGLCCIISTPQVQLSWFTLEYLNYENTKFSKSRNVGVFGNHAASTGISPSVWRYYLLSSRPETSDSTFTWKELIAKCNNELLANLGNFCNRVIKFIADASKYEGVIPPYTLSPENDLKLVEEVSAMLKEYTENMCQVKLRAGLKIMMELSQRGNIYLQEQGLDNALYANNRERCNAVVSIAANLVYVLASLIYPFMPETSLSIWRQLNVPPRKLTVTWTLDILAGHRIGKPEYLFRRIEPTKEVEWKEIFGAGPENIEKKKSKKK